MITKFLELRAKLMGIVEKLAAFAPLLIRITVGIVFVLSGWGKLHNLEKVIGFFTSLGIPAPQLQAPFVAGLEFVGGLALILGLGARLFAVPMMFTMVVAIITAKHEELTEWSDLFGFQEWDYLVFFVVIALIGPGPVSFDYLIGKKLRAPSLPLAAPQTPTSTSSSLQT
jgi:putative oxidoreductase